ncbi:DUF4185 domain-containing protein [Devosia sediminis]|uniref:DUF4185 domain-containing protein n=1 Tax=Devosia sediminis TaxID=2798801 RepID=A0A934MLB5_9HYPH|nr:DUF4185 domain-containing protein [Devosia sediminis]MBJ3786048.1 DUF4185 domain-containing protein [Devosia sediminis]
MRAPVLALPLTAALLLPAAAADYTVAVEKIAALTGPEATADMRGPDICGTDIGTIAELDGRMLFAFGDTFGFNGADCPRFGPNWRSNVLANSTDFDASDGIDLTDWLTGMTGRAVAVSEGDHLPAFSGADGEQTRIPTAMVAVGDRLYLHYMSVHGFAARGGEWECNWSRFVWSDDGGKNWTENETVFGESDSRFNMLALSNAAGPGNEDAAHVYAVGTACGRFGAGYAARVPAGDLLDLPAWQYWDGAEWSGDPDTAAEVIPPIAGEGSLVFNTGLGKWMYTTLDQDAEAIELYLADKPWGPWDTVIPLVSGLEFEQIYGAYMTPSLVSEDGCSFYFIMSQFGPYNTYVMRAELKAADADGEHCA